VTPVGPVTGYRGTVGVENNSCSCTFKRCLQLPGSGARLTWSSIGHVFQVRVTCRQGDGGAPARRELRARPYRLPLWWLVHGHLAPWELLVATMH